MLLQKRSHSAVHVMLQGTFSTAITTYGLSMTSNELTKPHKWRIDMLIKVNSNKPHNKPLIELKKAHVLLQGTFSTVSTT